MPSMVRSTYCLLVLTLAGCSTTPVAPIVERIPVPATLTAPCIYNYTPETNGELLDAFLDLKALLAECDERMTVIRSLGNKEVTP